MKPAPEFTWLSLSDLKLPIMARVVIQLRRVIEAVPLLVTLNITIEILFSHVDDGRAWDACRWLKLDNRCSVSVEILRVPGVKMLIVQEGLRLDVYHHVMATCT